MSSQIALPCPYCGEPVEMRFSQFHPFWQVLRCGSCSRPLGLPTVAKLYSLVALLLTMSVQMLILKDFGFWPRGGNLHGIAAHVVLFFGVIFSSQFVANVVCRLLTGRLVGRPDVGFAGRPLEPSKPSKPSKPAGPAPSTFTQILMLVTGLNVLLFIGTIVWAMSSGEPVTLLESGEPHVLSYRGTYVRVSREVHSWVSFHEWVTLSLTFLSIGIQFLEEIRDDRSEAE